MNLDIHTTPEAEVHPGTEQGYWYLQIPAGSPGNYRLAQLDDYNSKPRKNFPHQFPLKIQLRARTSSSDIPGTWGFGLWNDPFSLSLGFGGGSRRFPALPNAAWFFFSSPQNFLSFRDDLPAQGFVAQTFHGSNIPIPLLALVTPILSLLLWPKLARNLRPFFRYLIAEDSFSWDLDVTQWHDYVLIWEKDSVSFIADDQSFETQISPKGPLGLVLWIDNQYAAFPPDGHLEYGTLENLLPAWLEIRALTLENG